MSELVLRVVTIEEPQQTKTDELTKSIYHLILKDDEIKNIKDKNSQVD